ncbi:MAG TPA: FAD-dependent oxidoreductase, partial [Planctomycetota bacterium]|nr:FAD-dependent oxidoreductase [Planctomycetota bacterium]
MAARRLTQRGLRVRVIEATGVVGGRVRTYRRFSGGAHGELGGELLEEGNARTLALLDEVGLSRVRVLRRRFAMWEDAGTHGQRGWARLDDFLAPMARAWRRARRSWSSPLAARLARVSVEDWLDTVEADAQTRRSCRSLSRGMMLASPRRLSLLQLVDEWTGGGGGPRATFYRIRGGNDQLPQRLAAGLAESVVLRAPVTHVERTRRGCVVSARVGRKMRTFEGDGVVVALPPRPLLRVTFSPPLPARLHRALATIGFGGVTKSVLLLERSGWRRCGPGGAWGSDARAGSFWDPGEGQAGHPPLLSV